MKIEKLEICKFFDVKTPFRGTEKSACYDLYMPKFTNEFIVAFCKRNKCFFDVLDNSTVFFRSESYDFETIDKSNSMSISDLEKYEKEYYDEDAYLIMSFFSNPEYYTIYHNCTIPSGIGFNIPENLYIDYAPRSSNFAAGYSSIKSVIDEDYTYGTGIQIVLINFDENEQAFLSIDINEDERISQFMVKEYINVEEIVVIDENDWNNKPEIITKRNYRSGGFGHTGKK